MTLHLFGGEALDPFRLKKINIVKPTQEGLNWNSWSWKSISVAAGGAAFNGAVSNFYTVPAGYTFFVHSISMSIVDATADGLYIAINNRQLNFDLAMVMVEEDGSGGVNQFFSFTEPIPIYQNQVIGLQLGLLHGGAPTADYNVIIIGKLVKNSEDVDY